MSLRSCVGGILVVGLVLLLMPGCATAPGTATHKLSEKEIAALREQVADCMPPNGQAPEADVVNLYTELQTNGNHEAVRLCYSIALQAIAARRWDEATRVMDAAISRLMASTAGDVEAKKARKKFHAEEEKKFRGEPYEQATIYLTRGLLYMQAGDFENARAMFRSGALCDRSTIEDKEYEDDMAEMDYLEGLCNAKLKDKGKLEDNLKFAGQHARSQGAVIAPPAEFNTVLVFFSGLGPYKYRTGQYKQFLRFAPGTGAHGPLRVKVGDAEAANVTGPLDSLSFQATTRGGREIDAVLKGKAQFKTGAGIIGDVLVGVGAGVAIHGLQSNDRGGAIAGLAILLVGAAVEAAARAANPEADARMLLPIGDDVYVIPLQLPSGQSHVRIECPETGAVSEVTINRTDKPCDVIWAWDASFGVNVQRARLANASNVVAQRKDPWVQKWAGTYKQGDSQTPVAIYVGELNDTSFTGFFEANGQCCPCRGASDGKDFRLEYRDPNDIVSNDMYDMYTGKCSGGGKKCAGQALKISGGTANPAGTFNLALQSGNPVVAKSAANTDGDAKTKSKKSKK